MDIESAQKLVRKRRSTVEPPGTCEDSLRPALQHSCTACASSRIGHTRFHATHTNGVSCHITLATVVPPRGEGQAPAAGTNHAPPGDRQAPAVDEGPLGSTNSRGNNGEFSGAWLDRHGIRPSYLGLRGSAPSGSGVSVLRGGSHYSTHCSHAESAAMLADPMVGYWCRVGSQALTHTRTDIFGAVAIWDQRRTMLSIFVVPSLLLRECGQGLVPLVRRRLRALFTTGLFVCGECMPVMSCIGPLFSAWVVGLLPDATYSSPDDHFDGIGLYPKLYPSFGSLPKPCSCNLSNHLGFGPRGLSGMFSTLFYRR